MSYGVSAIGAVDWRPLGVLRGTGEDLAMALLTMLSCDSADEMEQIWWRLENVVFAQDTIYGAAEETVHVLMAALADDLPRVARSWIIELLFFLLKGGSLDDPSLPERCRQQARPGLWLLAQQARISDGAERDLVLKVVESIDSTYAEAMRDALTAP